MQRVSRATVRVAGEAVADMGPGLLALVGVAEGDGPEQAIALARKLVHLRIFEDAEGRMNYGLLDTEGTLGIVSQFTLLADTSKGRRPFFGAAADPAIAEPLVEAVVAAAQREGASVVTGQFGAKMQLELANEGPVTLLVET